jgi:CMP-N-acetylneuraminic acid synthetase
MSNKPLIYAMIPARLGSTRLKMKNLALINNKPMISYAIEAAKKSGIFDKVVLNSESEIFNEIANRHEILFYHRPAELGSSKAKSDLVIADFMHNFPEADIVVWVNPISPFQTSDEIVKIISYFIINKLDSLITTEEKQVHCNFNNEPLNYSLEGAFEQTQDLKQAQLFVYSIMMWKSEKFLSEFDKKGFGMFCGKFSTFPVSKLSSIIIKNKDDLMLADLLMQVIAQGTGKYNVKYDKLV